MKISFEVKVMVPKRKKNATCMTVQKKGGQKVIILNLKSKVMFEMFEMFAQQLQSEIDNTEIEDKVHPPVSS